MNEKSQIYFQIYENLEREVIDLTSSIHFSDEQLNVYSIKIADLIVRCSVEIESISKEIYRKENDMSEDISAGSAIKFLDELYDITNKKIKIYSRYFHLSKDKMELKPFKYTKKSKEDYYTTYNCIKHDRNKNLRKANIDTLIRVLGALFILNIYFKDEVIHLEKERQDSSFDKSGGSKIFNFYVAPCEDVMDLDSEKNINKEECIYEIIKKVHENLAFKINYIDLDDENRTISIVNSGKEFQEYANLNLNKKINILDFNDEFPIMVPGVFSNFNREFKEKVKAKEIISISAEKMKPYYYAEIRKNKIFDN